MNELEFYTKRYNDELNKIDLHYSFDENMPVYGNYYGLSCWIGNEFFGISKKMGIITNVAEKAEYSKRMAWYLLALTKRTLRIFKVKEIDDKKAAREYFEKWYRKIVSGFKIQKNPLKEVGFNLDSALAFINAAARETKDSDFIRETFLATVRIKEKIRGSKKDGIY